jgi:DNA-binding NtrC family response regulator
MGRILVVDHEPQEQNILAESLAQDQHIVSGAAGVEEARGALRNQAFDVIVTERRMPDGDALDVVAAARQIDPNVSVIFLAEETTLRCTIESTHMGSFDLLAKPLISEVVRAAALRACEHTALLRENSRLKAEVERLTRAPEPVRSANGAGNGNHDRVDTGWIQNLPPSFDLRGLLAMLEKSLIERTLQSTRGAQAEAARRLGLSRSDLSYKLLKYELRKETTTAS